MNNQNKNDKYHYLTLYINSDEHPELFETYQTLIQKHNTQIIESKYPNAGFDILLPIEAILAKNSTRLFNYHIKTALHNHKQEPLSYYIYLRSSTATKTPLRLSNSTGIIDSGYRGFIHCCFDYIDNNPSFTSHTLEKYQRLTQICSPTLQPLIVTLTKNENDLYINYDKEIERNTGGFGSSGTGI